MVKNVSACMFLFSINVRFGAVNNTSNKTERTYLLTWVLHGGSWLSRTEPAPSVLNPALERCGAAPTPDGSKCWGRPCTFRHVLWLWSGLQQAPARLCGVWKYEERAVWLQPCVRRWCWFCATTVYAISPPVCLHAPKWLLPACLATSSACSSAAVPPSAHCLVFNVCLEISAKEGHLKIWKL